MFLRCRYRKAQFTSGTTRGVIFSRMGQTTFRAIARCVLLAYLTGGCGTIGIRYLGIRPDAPDAMPSGDVRRWCNLEALKLGNSAGERLSRSRTPFGLP